MNKKTLKEREDELIKHFTFSTVQKLLALPDYESKKEMIDFDIYLLTKRG